MSYENKWQFWIDRGGTFTDIVALAPDGQLHARKYLSENPDQYADAAVFGMRQLLQIGENEPFPADEIAAIRMGTTVATNALLTRSGERTLLLTTAGLADALAIGDQRRPDLFALEIIKPPPLYECVIEANERLTAEGEIITSLDTEACQKSLEQKFKQGFRSLAIHFLHGYLYPAHENRAAEIAREIGFDEIVTGHEAASLMRFVPRGQTAVADAYLTPGLRRYVEGVEKEVLATPLFFMQSNGGLASASAFSGKNAILSGPAAGIVGAAETASESGFDRIITFDMGGTSTDVAHFKGSYERQLTTIVAGTPLLVPMLDIHTVAAGGGSICQFAGGRYRVGPESAGARPGPACYGLGGPLTVTDCNLLTGRIKAEYFPKLFGKSGREAISRKAAEKALESVLGRIEKESGEKPDREHAADGFLEVAVELMARAIKRISIERGHTLKNYALACFGGAGGQHATRVADALGIKTVIIHPLAGVLSALGLGLSKLRQVLEQSLERTFDDTGLKEADKRLDLLEKEVRASLKAQGVAGKLITIQRSLKIRYLGSDTALEVACGPLATVRKSFESKHKSLFGFIDEGKEIIIESVGVDGSGGESPELPEFCTSASDQKPLKKDRMFTEGAWKDIRIFNRARLEGSDPVFGPALIIEDHGTICVEPGWQASVNAHGMIVMERYLDPNRWHESARLDPMLLEVFNNRFMGIAEEMGGVLERTAHSVNIKERLDFSCAIFDSEGNLVANAPHMPVHLGSMGESVRLVMNANLGRLRPGDQYMLNDPYRGGTHLPDVTVIAPVFLENDNKPSFFAASRGHHADIGGLIPGSMPFSSTSIEEEGVCFDNFLILRDHRFFEEEIRACLLTPPYPARNPDQNIADLKAQMAAVEKGIQGIHRMVEEFSRPVVEAYMGNIQDNAEEAVRRALDKLENGKASYPMDNGLKIEVQITVHPETRSATIDFSGSSAAHKGNYNAPLAVTKAAVLYVFRVLAGDDIPLNEGCLKPITLIVPKGCFLNPSPPHAVAAGNVETSQAVTNALFQATGKLAASQGTMNNFTFGNDHTQYYETIAGGAGAGAGFAGADAVHIHMTNSKLTDVEILEARYPVRLLEFGIRPGSGGAGKHRGGHGVFRKILFLEDMDLSLLTSHRLVPPPGLDGGGDGAVGKNTLIRADGSREELSGADGTHVKAGDSILIETPGGGAYGVKL